MASLQYSLFLRSPTAALLAQDASLAYITTTTEIKDATSILKHLQAQSKQVEKMEEKPLNTIESQDGLAVEMETSLLFKQGGGAYLPGVDENLLDEKTVTVPVMHFVRFDAEQKIKQIRLYWDQGTMLKQVEAIGRSGRNWPIRDGQAQIDAVSKSVKAAGQAPGMNGAVSNGARNQREVVVGQQKPRENLTATRDPHASLSLFAERNPNAEAASRSYNGPTLAPRASAKPAPRDFVDIAGEDDPATPGSTGRSPSPSKAEGVILKAGAGKHFSDNRLFDENEGPAGSPERKKTYGGKYEHFTFGDGEDAPTGTRPISQKRNKNATTFSFEDFGSSPKTTDEARPDHERHWGAGVQEDDPPTPATRPIVHAARPDADPHFAHGDESPAQSTIQPKSFQRQKGMGLYQDPLHADPRTASSAQTAKSTAIGTNNVRRGDDFDAHYSMAYSSPAPGVKETQMDQSKHANTRSDLDSNWSFGTPVKEQKIYKTAGDGMGGRKSTVLDAPESRTRKRERPDPEAYDDDVGPSGERLDDYGEGLDAGDGAVSAQYHVHGGKRTKLSARTTRFRNEEGVLPDYMLSDDDADSWAILRRAKTKGLCLV